MSPSLTTVVRQTIASLQDAEDHFNLREAKDDRFFGEWREPLPDLSAVERAKLDAIHQEWMARWWRGKVDAGVVDLRVTSPLLQLAGADDLPVRIRSEIPVEIFWESEEKTLRGRIDFLEIDHRL